MEDSLCVVRLTYQLDTVRPGGLSTRPYQQRPIINKTLSTGTTYQQGFIVGKLSQGMRCYKFKSTVGSVCVLVCVCVSSSLISSNPPPPVSLYKYSFFHHTCPLHDSVLGLEKQLTKKKK